MLKLLKALRQDEHGVILSAEIVIIGSLLIIGLITGLTCLQKSVNGELQDLAGAIGALDQSYSFSSHRKAGYAGQCCAFTAGSSFLNCETSREQCGDIVGCAERVHVTANDCGPCGQNGHCAEHSQGHVGCGQCGGATAGCAGCGSGGVVSGKSSRCIDTGVPGMKVTEWQGARSSEQLSVHNEVIVHPQQPVIPMTAEPACEECPPEAPSEAVLQHHPQSQTPQPEPMPATEPLPAPMPDTLTAPLALPMPPMT